MAEKPDKPIDEQRAEFIATMEKEQAEAAKPAEPVTEAPPVEETPKPAPFRFEAADGTVYEADSDKALYEKVTKALNDTKNAVKDRERKIHELKAAKPAETPAPETPPAETYDKKRFFELMEEDPAKALDYMDSYRFGVENPREVFGRVAQDRIAQKVGMEFYAKVTEYAQIETPALNKMLFDRMEEQGRTKTNPDLMALTYYELKNEGKIPKASAPRRKAEVPEAPPESPTGGGGQPSTELTYAQAMEMKREDLAKEMKKRGIQIYNS